ncbi:protein-methionine-sulfoxide reductase catalytic subunit MsrP [Beijerinckia indica]|uniref:Protein-methionine-sulfoxide reductase catalytic subunit MsrP n=1 Tax=Beijerinckia indica subsp. indica (strain ATCC 9039 / DSM 1715 / NCIMB 8712) TaxID=395963 RepID=B2IBU3_BEII9|nr:protein-methionine-sulfoxide reductase catalytic subunit MsrP [Beijerinckia indica]ACB93815.1 oxidoreductase molybdopterin binding [Beijerinckia indica subsp. indica ATCC 9039]
MPFHRRRGWEIAACEATPESLFLNRRAFLRTSVAAGALLTTGLSEFGGTADAEGSSASLYPAKTNSTYSLDRPLTPERVNAHYNNFYEFGATKNVAEAAESLRTRPWTLKVDGLVEAPRDYAIDDLERTFPLEERLYRHRCVEAWSMTIPWTGFPLRALLDQVRPLSGARYVRMETFHDAKMAPGQRQFWYPWPYVEGLTIAEAGHDLAFLVTGAYGKPLGKVFGAPLRLAVPWKYGFKSIKSITRISLVAERPKTFWEQLQASEYGFWANVNPAVAHPRWSQASEEVIGTGERRPTLLFNGYGEQVASLYAGLQKEVLYR